MAAADQHVTVLDPGIFDANGDLSGAGSGLVDVGEVELVVGIEDNGLHTSRSLS
ncbi:hypothetical protein AB0M44_41075 [Streptosporangium subroseum]|uniref:hypothetical protein n=1 Tax=Streptosporangium subroseum TaxID=106412 RepID=UPI00343C40F0